MGDKKPSPKPSTRRPKVSDYEMETLPMQKQVQVVLTHLKDPNDFHLVLVEKFQNDLNPLLAQIHEVRMVWAVLLNSLRLSDAYMRQ